MAVKSALSTLILESCLKPLVGQQKAHTSLECVNSHPKTWLLSLAISTSPVSPRTMQTVMLGPSPTQQQVRSKFCFPQAVQPTAQEAHSTPSRPTANIQHVTSQSTRLGQPHLPPQTWQLAPPQQTAHSVHVGNTLRTYSSGDQSGGCHWATQDVYYIRPLQEYEM